MLEAIGNFFGRLRDLSREELADLRKCLIVVWSLTIFGVVAILAIKPAIEISVWITVFPWMYSAYRLYSVRRIINVHLTGEALELARVPVADPSEPRQETGVFDNDFIRGYLSIISNIFLVQTALFLVLPLYVNYTFGGMTAAIVILMLMVVIAIDNFTSFKRLSRFTVKVAVVAYTVGLVFVLFPQTGFYMNELVGDRIKIIPASTAKLVNDIDDFQKQKKIEANDKFLKDVAEYQKRHPKEEMPQAIRDEIKKIKKEG